MAARKRKKPTQRRSKNSPRTKAELKPAAEVPRHIICVSDLHIGSTVAICPSECRLDDGGLYRYSDYQAVLWEWWREFWEDWVPEVTQGQKYAIVINGDVLEGKHHDSTTVISNNLADQAKIAEKVLDPIRAKTDYFFVVRGTEAHAGKTGQEEERLAQKLCATGKAGSDNASHWDLAVSLNGHLLHFAHHIGTTSSAAYQTSALCRELVNAFTHAGQFNEPCPYMIIRSHRHLSCGLFVPSHYQQAYGIITPSWQLQTPFAYRNTMVPPHLGGFCLTRIGGHVMPVPQYWSPEMQEPVVLDDVFPERYKSWREKRKIT